MRDRKTKVFLGAAAIGLSYLFVFPALTPDKCVAYQQTPTGDVIETKCTMEQRVRLHLDGLSKVFSRD